MDGQKAIHGNTKFSAATVRVLDRCASSGHQMPDDRDHGKDQKQMDQTARDVKSGESENPKNKQNDTY